MNTDSVTSLQWKFRKQYRKVPSQWKSIYVWCKQSETKRCICKQEFARLRVTDEKALRLWEAFKPAREVLSRMQPCIEFALNKKLVYPPEVFPYESLKGAVDIGVGRNGVSDRRLPCDSCY